MKKQRKSKNCEKSSLKKSTSRARLRELKIPSKSLCRHPNTLSDRPSEIVAQTLDFMVLGDSLGVFRWL